MPLIQQAICSCGTRLVLSQLYLQVRFEVQVSVQDHLGLNPEVAMPLLDTCNQRQHMQMLPLRLYAHPQPHQICNIYGTYLPASECPQSPGLAQVPSW